MIDAEFWLVTLLIGLGSFLFRLGFHAFSGKATPSPYLRRALETLPPAILTALLAPMVFRFSADAGGGMSLDPPMVAGVAVALAVGVATRNFIWALLGGLGTGAAMLIAFGAAA